MDSSEKKGLTSEEDDSLRRLAWFAQTVGVSQWTRTRIDDLRKRDRRNEVRPPREESIAACAADILSRTEVGQSASDNAIKPADLPGAADAVPGTGNSGSGKVASLTVVRQKKRRHPWSLKRDAKGS